MNKICARLISFASLVPLLLLAACSGGGGGGGGGGTTPSGSGGGGTTTLATYTIGGTVSGLAGAGGGLVISDSYQQITINANGGFTFSTAIYGGFPYTVSVVTQPNAPAQVCSVTNGSGTISGNVTNVQVVCANSVTVNVTGLAGTMVLQNGADMLTIPGSGTTFPTLVPTGSTYNVTVLSTSPAQLCSVANGSGTAAGNVTASVNCVNTISGTITGLSGTVVLQDNGIDSLSVSANGAFTFAMPITTGSPYLASVLTQPTGQTCRVTDNSGGTAYGNVTNVIVACSNGQWTWMGGSSTTGQTGTYGTKGTGATTNIPGARYSATSATDSTGGNLWLFGGYGYGATSTDYGYLNDLWMYTPSNGQWTWVSGSTAANQAGVYGTKGTAAAGNIPGSRSDASSWIDTSGNLWVFGGDVYMLSEMNDLWKYNASTKQWTWMSGSSVGGNLNVAPTYGTRGTAAAGNVPGGRFGAVSVADGAGNLWLFGGYAWDSANSIGPINDLWKYNIATGMWTWMSGANVGRQLGNYGTQGVAATANVPGARQYAMGWYDAAGGNIWIFGGDAQASANSSDIFNDLWKYNIATGMWTWVSGSNVGGQPGVYGTMGVASAANVPSARQYSMGTADGAGNLWLFGGRDYNGWDNDLWKFNIASGQWTWMNGSKLGNEASSYGTLGVSGTSLPGGRELGASWIDSGGNQWYFGSDAPTNDLWRFK